MKVYANKIHLILGFVALTQIGCNGNQQRGQYLYPNVSTQAQDLTTTGDAFRRTNTGAGSQGNLANLFNGMARGANPGLPGQGTMTQAQLEQAALERLKAEEAAKKKAEEGGSTQQKTQEESEFVVNTDDQHRAETGCSVDANNDNDSDGLSNDCETNSQWKGLDPNVFNGFIVTAMKYAKNDIPDSSKAKSINIKRGLDADYSYDKKIVGYYLEQVEAAQAAKQNLADLRALKKFLTFGTQVHPHPSHFAKDKALYASFDKKYAMIPGIDATAVPFGLESGAASLANLSGIESTSINLATDYGFMYMAKANVMLSSATVNIRVASLRNQNNAVVGSKAGMFFVLGNGNTEILVSDMFESKSNGKSLYDPAGSLSLKPGCATADMTIVFFSDKKMENLENVFAETVVYKDGNTWRPFSQDMLRAKPSGAKCTYDTKDMIFEIPEIASGV